MIDNTFITQECTEWCFSKELIYHNNTEIKFLLLILFGSVLIFGGYLLSVFFNYVKMDHKHKVMAYKGLTQFGLLLQVLTIGYIIIWA